jgi:aminoglycoside phosphotransferase family enzyme/predicted kinase
MTTPSEDQPPLIHALLTQDVYPHDVYTQQLIETHISWVILTGDYAYKIKKPVNLGFLDFSTLTKRKHYCEEELRLNRRLAPDTYVEVIAIGGTPQAPLLGATSDIFEYAVKMREFPQQAQLDQMLVGGELCNQHIDALADLIAGFHGKIAVAEADSPYGNKDHIRKAVNDTIESFFEHLHDKALISELKLVRHWIEQQYYVLDEVFQYRKKQGFIRECHGDMHLRNLAWVDNAPVVFDCIEFNPNLLWNDVISEVAFLVMDLDDRRQPAFAQRFLNSYLELTGDYDGLAVLPFYLVYRALVRGMVAAIRYDQPHIEAQERQQAESEVRDYLQLARQYLTRRNSLLILARGPSGSGKTTHTQNLLETLGAVRVRSDVERKRIFGLGEDDDGSSAVNQGIYTPQATQDTYQRLRNLAEKILANGFSVIVDATFQRKEQRQLFSQLASDKKLSFIILEFTASTETLKKRIQARSGDVSDADLAVLEHQLKNWQPLLEWERQHCIVIDTEGPVNIDTLLLQLRSRTTENSTVLHEEP